MKSQQFSLLDSNALVQAVLFARIYRHRDKVCLLGTVLSGVPEIRPASGCNECYGFKGALQVMTYGAALFLCHPPSVTRGGCGTHLIMHVCYPSTATASVTRCNLECSLGTPPQTQKHTLRPKTRAHRSNIFIDSCLIIIITVPDLGGQTIPSAERK